MISMSEVKQSPEEWSIKPFGTGLDIINQDGEDLAFVRVTSRGPELAQTRAHLIAAAPTMLEALKAAVSQVHLTDRSEPMSPDVQRVFDQCCAAIAKAEGRS